MNPIAILKEVEADVKAFGSISGDIRAKLKSGVADLTAVRDEMNTLVETVMGKAKAALSSLKTVADEVSKDAGGDEGTPSDPAPQAEEPAAPVVTESPSGAMVTVDRVVGATTHEDASGTTTVVPHDGSDAHAHDAAMQPAEVKPEAVQEAVQATVDAGVATPEAAPVV